MQVVPSPGLRVLLFLVTLAMATSRTRVTGGRLGLHPDRGGCLSPALKGWTAPNRLSAWSACSRRTCVAAVATSALCSFTESANAFVAGDDEEVSGLVVLRVAEVCAFQEKLLRTLAACGNGKAEQRAADQFGNLFCGEAYSVNPTQIIFGTGVLLRNSNLDGNLKLMIQTELPRASRPAAIKDAVAIMNTFNELVNTASSYETFEAADLIVIADIYSSARKRLARFFDYLPGEAQSRFYNYAEDVRKYEEKVSRDDGIERMKL